MRYQWPNVADMSEISRVSNLLSLMKESPARNITPGRLPQTLSQDDPLATTLYPHVVLVISLYAAWSLDLNSTILQFPDESRRCVKSFTSMNILVDLRNLGIPLHSTRSTTNRDTLHRQYTEQPIKLFSFFPSLSPQRGLCHGVKQDI